MAEYKIDVNSSSPSISVSSSIGDTNKLTISGTSSDCCGIVSNTFTDIWKIPSVVRMPDNAISVGDYDGDLMPSCTTTNKIILTKGIVDYACKQLNKIFNKEDNKVNDTYTGRCVIESAMMGKVPPVKPKAEKDKIPYRYMPAWLKVARVVYNNPATIVFWEDGEKTVVKCQKDEVFNEYAGFCAAVAKRVFENNSRVIKIVKNATREDPKPEKTNGKISAEVLGKVRTMILDGKKTTDIAKTLDIPLSLVRSITAGVKNEQLQEKHIQIMELRAKHYSMAKISEKLGIPESTVRYVVKKERQIAKEKENKNG